MGTGMGTRTSPRCPRGISSAAVLPGLWGFCLLSLGRNVSQSCYLCPALGKDALGALRAGLGQGLGSPGPQIQGCGTWGAEEGPESSSGKHKTLPFPASPGHGEPCTEDGVPAAGLGPPFLSPAAQ